jgi:hypothetical protein
MRGAPAALAALSIIAIFALSGPASAANFGAHAGLSEDTVPDPYFVAGALLADLDHFLPPGEPQTDSDAFTRGVISRAWTGSHRAWALARGWLESRDQDARFVDAVVAIRTEHPSYTDTDVRLAFDYWTLAKHPFSTAFDFLLADYEVHGIIARGLVATDVTGVRGAIYDLLYSTDLTAPGLFAQLNAARLYGILYPQIVRDVEPHYDAFYAGAVAGYTDPFPPLSRMLAHLHQLVRGLPWANRFVFEALVLQARALEQDRPAGWFYGERVLLQEIVNRARSIAPGVGDAARQILVAIEPP